MNSLERPAVPSRPIGLRLVDGVNVVVPDAPNLLTPYVLQEQLDWFEDEIRFLRTLMRPGNQAIDVGANYGVYTLSIARAVGPGGHVWAFEPASQTADYLEQGIRSNRFTNVTLDRRALSCEVGLAQLRLCESSELNALVAGPTKGEMTESVQVTTLDELNLAYRWRDIDFVKIDAEGEEANIIEGGRQFFAQHSPLVQFEVKAGASLRLDLVERFEVMGFRSYRLVPGLNMLAPLRRGGAIDEFLLNLFCCKPDRAEILAHGGFLAGQGQPRSRRA